jgi:hypothetical protein
MDGDFKGRREHDGLCDLKWVKRQEWVLDKICIATKGTKAKQAIMFSIMGIMLAAALTSAYKSISIADESITTHVRNTNDIAHNKEKIKEGREDHNHLVETVEEIQRTQNRMDRNLGRLMGAMGVEAEE